MCTAISFNSSRHLFCRTLDLDSSHGESVVCTPRSFRLNNRHRSSLLEHYAILGVGCVFDDTPLYYDAFNEKGLAAAALNFPGEAVYFPKRTGAINVASFELITAVLSQCASLSEATCMLEGANITDDSFSAALPTTPLHWIIADKSGSVTLESTVNGLRIYENPFGVLTNSPVFSYHTTHVADFIKTDSEPPENKITKGARLLRYSNGLGAMGLPGDFSSSSRFVRAVFLKNHSFGGGVSSAFDIMDNLSVPRGAVITDTGKPFVTVYTSVADTDEKVYYFTTEDSRRIRAVNMSDEFMTSDSLSVFPMQEKEKIFYIDE